MAWKGIEDSSRQPMVTLIFINKCLLNRLGEEIRKLFHSSWSRPTSSSYKRKRGARKDGNNRGLDSCQREDVWVWKQLSVKSTEERIHYGSTVFISQEFTSVEPGFSYKIGAFLLRYFLWWRLSCIHFRIIRLTNNNGKVRDGGW